MANEIVINHLLLQSCESILEVFSNRKLIVTYIKSMVRRRTDPPFPIRATAVAGGTSPRPASLSFIGKSRARAPRPNDVAKENGTANHTKPPNK